MFLVLSMPLHWLIQDVKHDVRIGVLQVRKRTISGAITGISTLRDAPILIFHSMSNNWMTDDGCGSFRRREISTCHFKH